MPCNAFLHFFISHLKMASPSKGSKRPRMITELSTGGSHGRDCISERNKPQWQKLDGVLPTLIVLDDDTSTNILVRTNCLKSALEKLTCLKCGEADNHKLCPITMSTKRQGIASTISLRCSKHEFNIESEIVKLDNDNPEDHGLARINLYHQGFQRRHVADFPRVFGISGVDNT